MKEKKVYFVSLGCSKNLIDSEVMLGSLKKHDFSIAAEPKEATVIVINTCGFIDAAKKESIDNILEMAEYKDPSKGVCQILVVAGCLTQRYSADLEIEIPEVDLFIGTGEYNKIVELLDKKDQGKLDHKSFVNTPKFIHSEDDERMLSTPSYTAWLKVSEGCDRCCTFCAIPAIRGKLRSRSVASLVKETKHLVEQGVKEINLVSQDLSKYGQDLGGENTLINMLKGLEAIEGLVWIRLFYYYPDDLSVELVEFIKNSKKVCHYLDMPVQHFSDSVLKRMNRQITGTEIHKKIALLRERIPDMVIRTSIIVGFPGESEEDFETLLEGAERVGFDHLGVFKYSDEEGTPAFNFKEKTSEEIIDERHDALYELQKEIAEERNERYIGKTLEVLVEGFHEETDQLIVGRHRGQAPDIDGKVIINDDNGRTLKQGDLVLVEVSEVHEYDLIGRVV